MKLIICLIFLLASAEAIKIKLHKMKNFFKKSLLNLNDLDEEELDDISVIIIYCQKY